ncbi:MAG: DoxX protein [Aequorivita sp.]
MNSTFTRILRVILGLGLIFFGLSKFIQFNFMPTPTFTEEATNFMKSLHNTGYVLLVLGAFEIIIGLLLLFKKWVSFALILLAPITLNILLFHLFLDSPGILLAMIVVGLNGMLIYKHWKNYRPLFN